MHRVLKKALVEIAKLLDGELRDAVNGRIPRRIQDRVQRYERDPILAAAIDELKIVHALAEQIRDHLRPLERKDTNDLQIHFGVNAFSHSATKNAHQRMQAKEQTLRSLRAQSQALPGVAQAIYLATRPTRVATSLGMSDGWAVQRIRTVCSGNQTTIDRLLKRMESISTLTEKTLRAHEAVP